MRLPLHLYVGSIVASASLLLFGVRADAQAAPAPAASSMPAEAPHSVFFDRQDGEPDLSEWLLEKKGFLPVPILITEPAVGYGGGFALGFFNQSIGEAAANAKKSGHVTPPDLYGVAFAATENGTRFGGIGGMFTFHDDRWRYRGGIGRADIHLDFYGVGDSFGQDYQIGYALDGWVSSQQLLYRLGESSNFLAVRWLYLDIDARFDGDRELPDLPEHAFATRSSGLGLSFEHDSRNNIFTPSRGMLAALDTMFYAPDFGSDNRFQSYRAHLFSYTPLSKSVVLGGRLDGRLARGDVPFYQLPYVDMRGVPAMRYQGSDVVLAEMEARWSVTERWGLIGFAGAGRAWDEDQNFGDTGSRVAKGAGFRYQIARVLGLWVGMDYAWGPDGEEAFYIQVGNAWR